MCPYLGKARGGGAEGGGGFPYLMPFGQEFLFVVLWDLQADLVSYKPLHVREEIPDTYRNLRNYNLARYSICDIPYGISVSGIQFHVIEE